MWDGVAVQHPVLKNDATHRRDGIISWWAYTFLAFLTLFTIEKKERLPKGLHKLLFSIEYRRQPLASRWKWKTVTNIAIKGTKDSIITTDSCEDTTSVKIHITILNVAQLFTQLVSVVAFCGSIIVQERQNARGWSTRSLEPFAAVGQWSNLAVVFLMLVAAGVGRIWAGTGAGSAVVEEERRLEEGVQLDDDAKSDYWRDGEDEDVGTEKEDWDWRVGYAS